MLRIFFHATLQHNTTKEIDTLSKNILVAIAAKKSSGNNEINILDGLKDQLPGGNNKLGKRVNVAVKSIDKAKISKKDSNKEADEPRNNHLVIRYIFFGKTNINNTNKNITLAIIPTK